MDIYSEMSVIMMTASMLSIMPGISVSLFSVWFCLSRQYAMKRSWLGFRVFLFCTDVSLVVCNVLCNRLATSSLTLDTSALRSVTILPSLIKFSNETSQVHLVFLMLHYIAVSSFCAGHTHDGKSNWHWDGVVWCFISMTVHAFLACSNPTSSPTPDA